MRRLFALLGAASLVSCNVDFDQRKAPPAGLARRIAQKQNAVLQNPNDVGALLELGELQLEGEQWFEAADTLKKAKDLGNDDIRIAAGLTTAYFELGYFKPGIEELKSCIQRDRNHPDCLYAYAKLVEPDQSKKAKEELRQVWLRFLAVAPNHKKASYARSSLEQLNAQLGPMETPPPVPSSQPDAPPEQPDEPASQPAQVPGHPDGSPEPREDVGELNPFGRAIAKAVQAVQRNDAKAAEAAFREALKIRPEDAGAMAGLAETMLAQNRTDEAVKTIEKAYDLDKTDPQVRWAFGIIMIRAKKRIGEAVAAWEALAKDDPEYAERLGIPERLETIKKFMTDGHGQAPK